MRSYLVAIVATALLSGALAAQPLSFDDFVWTFDGPASASGFVTSDLLHVTGPRGGNCDNQSALYTTTAPFAGTVRVHLEWDIQDICHFDWPLYSINGMLVKIPVWGDTHCFLPGTYDLEFDVQAGDAFGLGVGSSDCWEGPGIADFTEFSFLPPAWVDVGGLLDPRIELDIAGPAAFSEFGSSLATVGDVDGDGLAEIAIAGSSNSFPYDGTVSLHAGADGTVLWTVMGSYAFGMNLVPLGDVDGDGEPDLVASNHSESQVHVLSGADGHALWTFTESGLSNSLYGWSLAAHADLDGDGILDVAAGANKATNTPVRVLSGATGAELALIQPGSGDSYFGRALGAPGDLDGDGVGELMVGARGSPARVRVFSGASGAQLFELHSPSPYPTTWNTTRLIGVGDWDGDGVRDMAVGAHNDVPNPPTGGLGAVTIFSGATGSVLLSLQAPAGLKNFGYALAGGTDVDGDGAPDLAIGVPQISEYLQPKASLVQIVRAPDGALLHEILGAPSNHLGEALDWQAGTASPTLAVGIPAKSDTGAVRLYSDLLHPSGAPLLSMYGILVHGTPGHGTPWFVHLDHGLPGNLALLVVGVTAPAVPFKGGVLVPSPDRMVPVPLDAAGGFESGVNAPAAVTSAISLWIQAWMPDSAGPQGWSATRALKSPPP